ncbi:uncharacterized protein LOC116143933 [Pistacia vera]|uniref:uncharacterized protein LOC116143933 n=1 Tax=Pistacia vera TaxID=55513 RepID=UPI00126365D2|nr:uncharacterized protein LOC116143933 [Pistacia vera]
MASSLPTTSCSLNITTSPPPSPSLNKHKPSLKLKHPQVRSQNFKDEGKSADMVEANLSVLRRRIDEVKKKESLSLNQQHYCGCRHQNGWNYQRVYYDHHLKHKKFIDQMISESIQILGSAIGAVGFVFLTGSFFIFLVSFLVHNF